MNKKFLSVVLFGALMAGSSVTFTGCIDNDEPAGIETLRGAKAELLKAKTAVEQAKVAWVEADAAYRAAEAREKEALAAQAEVQTKRDELAYAIAQAQSEATIQEAKNALEEAKHALEMAQLQWEEDLLIQKQSLAEAQKAYDDAMKALELSKTYLSQDELDILDKVSGNYDTAKKALDDANIALNSAYDAYKTAVIDAKNYLNEATLNEAVSVAEENVAKATNKLNLKLEALKALESDDKYAAWQDVRKDFQHKLDSVAIVIADKKDQEARLIAYEENHSIATLDEANKKVLDIKPGKVSDKNPDAFKVSAAIQSHIILNTNADAGILEYKNGSLSIKNFNTSIVGGYKDKDGKGGDGDYEAMLKYNFVFDASNGYEKTSKAIAGAISDVTKAKNGVDPNIPAWAEDDLEKAKEKMDAAKKASDTALDAWKKAVAALGTDYNAAAFNDDDAVLNAQAKTAVDAVLPGDQALVEAALSKYKVTYAKMISYDQTITQLDKVAIDKAIESVDAFKTAAENGNVLTGKFTFKEFSSEEVLEQAAVAAFGDAYQDEEMNVYRVMPKDEYVLANDQNVKGAYTQYLKLVEAYNEAEEKVKLDEQFDAVLAQLNAWAKTLSDAKEAYETANQATLNAVTSAQNTVKEKVVAPIAALKLAADTAYETDIKDMLEAITENEDVKEFEKLISDLKKEIGVKAGVDGAETSTQLYLAVEQAEAKLLNAEKTLELYKEGNLKEQYIIDNKKKELEIAKADYNRVLQIFNYWSDKLAATMETLYGTASAE